MGVMHVACGGGDGAGSCGDDVSGSASPYSASGGEMDGGDVETVV